MEKYKILRELVSFNTIQDKENKNVIDYIEKILTIKGFKTEYKDKNLINMKTVGNELVITSFASEIGKSEESVAISKNNDNDIAISYSAKYMLDALKTLKDDELIILMNGDSKPIILKNAKDESLIQLILPIKTY